MVMRSIIDIHDIGRGPGYLIKGEKGRWRKSRAYCHFLDLGLAKRLPRALWPSLGSLLLGSFGCRPKAVEALRAIFEVRLPDTP